MPRSLEPTGTRASFEFREVPNSLSATVLFYLKDLNESEQLRRHATSGLERALTEPRMAGIKVGENSRLPGSRKLRSKLRTRSPDLADIG